MYATRREEKQTGSVRIRRMRSKNFEFIAVDGEGAGEGKDHRYVLLGCGERQIENLDGLSWKTCFQFLYECFEENPDAAFVGFFLGYDFTQILKTLPKDRAQMLLTDRGINARKRRNSGGNTKPFPVRFSGWEFDMLGGRRLQIRPQACHCVENRRKDCDHKQSRWMYICDAGAFWQTSLLSAINPRNWGGHPVVTQEEYDTVEAGKAGRSMSIEEYIQQRERIQFYNRLENRILARIMDKLRDGFLEIGVNLRKDQWFGPGQAAAAWFKKNGVPRRNVIEDRVPEQFLEASRKSYFGGWFEIFAHGIVPGTSHEYDINSAYPHIIAELPCLLHGRYDAGSGRPSRDDGDGRRIRLIRARIFGNDPNIGALLNRSADGRIRRPHITEGWYWEHEIEAAKRAGLVDRAEYHEWVSYDPCKCDNPVRGFRDLYEHRLRVGKDTILGKSSKLVYNSGYGKFAQSTGSSPYGNWVYASLITAGCRVMILDAIATHPQKSQSVLMVATDGIFFDSPHPSLPISKSLGSWDYASRENLCLFKPGVYWDDKARERIRSGNPVGFKARGVNARDFSRHIGTIDRKFLDAIDPIPGFRHVLYEGNGLTAYGETPWPYIDFPITFTMTSVKTALMRGTWEEAGMTQEGLIVRQDSDPLEKRTGVYFDPRKNRLRTSPIKIDDDEIVSTPYEKRYGLEDPFSQEVAEWNGINPDGTITNLLQYYGRVLSGRE
jgi:DNA polymerase type B, organellar and viral